LHSTPIYLLKTFEASFQAVFFTFPAHADYLSKKYNSFTTNDENKRQLTACLVLFDTFTNETNSIVNIEKSRKPSYPQGIC